MCTRSCRNCGTLVARRQCMFCFACTKIVKAFDWRGSVRVKWMSDTELEFYGAPAWIPDECPDVAIVGFLNVGKRVLQELLMPGDWKARNFVREKTEALAAAQHAKFCWHLPQCAGNAVKTYRAFGSQVGQTA